MKFETKFTRDFIQRSFPAGARRVLEIGCGSGELAASLLQDRVWLVAIDNDADLIAAAQGLGVDARIAAWPNFENGQFDAVLFTRNSRGKNAAMVCRCDRPARRCRPSVQRGRFSDRSSLED
jgi:SAM-dependent methyltransferase